MNSVYHSVYHYVLANGNKETQGKKPQILNNSILFYTFYNDYTRFKHYIKHILSIWNKRNAKIVNKANIEEINCWWNKS